MKARLINIWDLFRSSFWFVPTLMVLVAVALAIGCCRLDREFVSAGMDVHWLRTTAPAARSTLSSLAGATITLAGVVFSITILTLSIASSQYGSRIVRNVMTDSIADLVIGQYVGTSLYCLLVLRTIRDPNVAESGFVPQVATAVGLLLGVISLAMLIWFIHHVATAIQAPKLIEGVARDLNEAVERLFPECIGDRPDDDVLPTTSVETKLANLGEPAMFVQCTAEGYIEGIDGDSLVTLAVRFDAVIALDCKPGDFVTLDQPVLRVWFDDAGTQDGRIEDAAEQIKTVVNRVIIVGTRRSPRQDVAYAAWELVEIAVRALSPGINDPFTAMNCIDRLGAALGRLVQRETPSRVRVDSNGRARVLAITADEFPQVLDDGFNQIRQYGADSVAVSIRMLESLTTVARHAERAEDLEAIQRQADALRDSYTDQHTVTADVDDFDRRYQRLVNTLDPESCADHARFTNQPQSAVCTAHLNTIDK